MEVARLLIKDGESVSCLALLDAFGPDFPRRRNFVEWVKVKAANLKAQPLTPKLRRIGGSFNAVPGPVGDSPVSPTDALFSSYKEYVRGLAAYPGRITLFRAAVQPPGSRMSHDDMTNGWGSVARDGVEVILVPGTHLSMFEPPNLQAFADALQNRLRRPHQ